MIDQSFCSVPGKLIPACVSSLAIKQTSTTITMAVKQEIGAKSSSFISYVKSSVPWDSSSLKARYGLRFMVFDSKIPEMSHLLY